MAHAFFWYDVMTSDTKAALEFYSSVVGWGVSDGGAPHEMEYTLLTVDGVGVAGVMPIPVDATKMGVPPAWMGYIHVDDVDAMAKRITAEGGKVMKEPVTVPNTIRFAVVADPQGAGFLIAQPLRKDAPTWPAPGTPGTIGWHELFASDMKTALPFYEKLFGWTKADALDMGPMGTYQLFAAGQAPIGGMMTKTAEIPAPFWNYYINVPSVSAAAQKVTAGGGRIAMGPDEVPGGRWILRCFDPQGAFFALLSPTK
jgi:predicted enzyme related to lactoylglutathione lyase